MLHMPRRPATVGDGTTAAWRTRPIKIALIDTGVCLKDEVIRGERRRFRGRSWVDEDENDYNDLCGHGTHLARLVLKVSSTANILVAKVSRDKKFTAASIMHIVEVSAHLHVLYMKRKYGTDFFMLNLGHSLGC